MDIGGFVSPTMSSFYDSFHDIFHRFLYNKIYFPLFIECDCVFSYWSHL